MSVCVLISESRARVCAHAQRCSQQVKVEATHASVSGQRGDKLQLRGVMGVLPGEQGRNPGLCYCAEEQMWSLKAG